MDTPLPPTDRIDLSIDSAGRIVLPAETRRRLGLRAGSKLRMAVVAQRIELTPAPADDEAELSVSPSGRLVLAAGTAAADSGVDAPSAASAVRAERDAQARPRR